MVLTVLRRLGVFALTLLVASLIVFVLLAVLPGDPARAQLGLDATADQVAALRHQLGLDRPLPVQYLHWLGQLVTGNLGISYATRAPVGPEVLNAMQVSLLLVAAGMVVAALIALPTGLLAALRQGKPDGTALSAATQVGISVPSFLAGLLLVTVFAVRLHWLPSGGWVAPVDGVVPFLRHLVLPALALGLVRGAILSRYLRAAVLDVQREDFMRTARAKGMTRLQAMRRHGLRNALVPVVTVTGVEFAGLLVGAVVIETVFVIPGLGSLLLRSVADRDLVEVQAVVMVVVVLVLAINLLVDLVYVLVDPRLRRSR